MVLHGGWKPDEFYESGRYLRYFGNALDNAIEAVSRLEDPQQRVISVKAIYQKKILVIQFQNYYQGDLEFRNGIPRTTKQNKQDHGYGMKSIRYTVENITERSQ